MNRIVVITGGTGGLGKALARHYLRLGDQVILTGRQKAKLEQIQHELTSAKNLFVYPLDVTDNESVRTFAAWVKIRFERCDILFNNAGSGIFRPFAELSLDEIHQMLHTNVNGLMYVTRAFLPSMLEEGKGAIVNIASLAGEVATAKAAVYAASKASVIRFSEGLRHELKDSGVKLTCVLPGPFDTPFLDTADCTGQYRHQVRRYLLSPEKVADVIVRAVEKEKATVAMPRRLAWMSRLFLFLPAIAKVWLAPLINRK